MLAGRNVGGGFNVAPDAFVISGQTTPEDLLLQLQLGAAYLTDPGYRPEAERLFRRNIEQMYTRLAHTPQGPIQLEVSRLLAGGDPRFGTPAAAELGARTVDEVRAWLTPHLSTGPIEIAIVGDFDREAAIAAVAATFGALPARATKPPYTEERQVDLPDAFARSYTVPTEIPKGLVAVYWPTTDARDVGIARRLSLLGAILDDRLRIKVREELGGAYSPGAGSSASDTYHGYGYIIANVTVDPGQASEIAGVVKEIAADLAANGVTEDELNRARLPILTSIRESARTNAYWLGAVAASAQEFPQRLDWSRTRTSDFETIPKADVDALAKAYLGADRAIQVIVLPEAPTS
jgi:zinc protease